MDAPETRKNLDRDLFPKWIQNSTGAHQSAVFKANEIEHWSNHIATVSEKIVICTKKRCLRKGYYIIKAN